MTQGRGCCSEPGKTSSVCVAKSEGGWLVRCLAKEGEEEAGPGEAVLKAGGVHFKFKLVPLPPCI